MPVIVLCKNCERKIILRVKRVKDLPFVYTITCPYCGITEIYYKKDAKEQDIYRYICPICNRRFYIDMYKKKFPVKVECPYCKSVLILNNREVLHIIKRGKPPESLTTITTAIGTILGLSRGLSGAIGGGILGAFIGSILESIINQEELEGKILD